METDYLPGMRPTSDKVRIVFCVCATLLLITIVIAAARVGIARAEHPNPCVEVQRP